MIRYEIPFVLGLVLGIVLGVAGSAWWRRWLARRDAAIAATRVRVALKDVPTEELIDEASKRDDVGRNRGGGG